MSPLARYSLQRVAYQASLHRHCWQIFAKIGIFAVKQGYGTSVFAGPAIFCPFSDGIRPVPDRSHWLYPRKISQYIENRFKLTTFVGLLEAALLKASGLILLIIIYMKVAIIMGSTSDWTVMSAAVETLAGFGIEIEKRVISAHRTPDLMFEFAKTAKDRGIGVIIAGAGGAAHVAGVVAGMTTVPVIGVPMQTKALGGLDSLLSIVQMPGGVPVATVAINGAKNAALLAVEILALSDKELEAKLIEYRRQQTETVLKAEI